MNATPDLHGFEVAAVDLPRPPVPVSTECREALRPVVAAIIQWATPEAITGYLADGFPDAVAAALDRPHEGDEVDALIDLLAAVQQAAG